MLLGLPDKDCRPVLQKYALSWGWAMKKWFGQRLYDWLPVYCQLSELRDSFVLQAGNNKPVDVFPALHRAESC